MSFPLNLSCKKKKKEGGEKFRDKFVLDYFFNVMFPIPIKSYIKAELVPPKILH